MTCEVLSYSEYVCNYSLGEMCEKCYSYFSLPFFWSGYLVVAILSCMFIIWLCCKLKRWKK